MPNNEVVIIINKVRYNSTDAGDKPYCTECDLHDMCRSHFEYKLCEGFGISLSHVFKKTNNII